METNFDLASLFANAFGYETHAFDPKFNELPTRVTNSSKGAPYYDTDVTGREYFLPAVIIYTIGGEEKTYTLPNPVISITGRKNIIETALTERNGTVKEVINVQDYDIVIKGIIVNHDNAYPEADVATLIEIFETNAAVQLLNALTDILLIHPDRKGSDNVVVKELSFPPVAGAKFVKPYQLTLVSDAIFNLQEIQ